MPDTTLPCACCAGVPGALHAADCIAHARGEAAFCLDIPIALAVGAHRGTSHVPDERGAQERASYAATLAGDLAGLLSLAGDDPAKLATVAREWPGYRVGYGERVRDYLAARGRVMSTMVTGASRFPVARNQKRSDAADRKLREAIEFRTRRLARLRGELRPEDQPIRVEDDDAIERLRAKLERLQRDRAAMVAINAAIRKHAKRGADAQRAAIVALGYPDDLARQALTPDDLQRVGFPPYKLQNLGAEIRRVEARIADVTARKAAPEVQIEGERATVEEVPADNRIRVIFPGKPDAATRARLKAAGFRWAPSIGAWQAYPSERTREAARAIAGPAKPAPAAPDLQASIETSVASGAWDDDAARREREIEARRDGLGGANDRGAKLKRETELELEARKLLIAAAGLVPLDVIATLAHVGNAAAEILRDEFVAFVEATPGAPWDGWREALEAFKTTRATVPDPIPRDYLSTSEGRWRMITGFGPACADTDYGRARSVAGVIALELRHGWVWDGDGSRWRKIPDGTCRCMTGGTCTVTHDPAVAPWSPRASAAAGPVEVPGAPGLTIVPLAEVGAIARGGYGAPPAGRRRRVARG